MKYILEGKTCLMIDVPSVSWFDYEELEANERPMYRWDEFLEETERYFHECRSESGMELTPEEKGLGEDLHRRFAPYGCKSLDQFAQEIKNFVHQLEKYFERRGWDAHFY